MKLVRVYMILSSFLALFAICACKQEGAIEKAGSRADEVIDNVKEGEAPLKKKGALEKAGESVDKAVNGN